MQSHCDVIIVGAGLVGLVLAAILARQDLRVIVVEAGDVGQVTLHPVEHQLRVSALNLAARELFVDLNIWPAVSQSNRLGIFEKMFVWDSLGRGEIYFDCAQVGANALGFIAENAVIHNALLTELKNFSNVTILSKTRPVAMSMLETAIVLKLDQGKSLIGEVIVGADGANSWIRQQANIDSYIRPYDHHALVATVETQLSHQKTAWQCFLSDGPLALLPLAASNQCSIVWSGSPDEIKRLQNLKDKAFNLEITQAFEYRLGNIKKQSQTMTFPLYMRHAKNYTLNRIALVGDAAHTIHPLAGQGINLGFADVCVLAENIISAKRRSQDCGSYLWLRRYERTRKGDNWLMIFGMEFFKKLFENESAMTIYLRSLGLNMVNKTRLIKDQFIYKALGY